MREVINESYLLKGTEFALLLCGCNKDEIYCFPFIDGSEARDKYVYSVEKMVKNGFITPIDGGFLINEPYNEMIECIKRSDTTIIIRTSFETESDLCLYGSESGKLLIVSIPSRKDSVLLTYLEPSDFFELYLKGSILPEPSLATLEPNDEGFSEKALSFLEKMRSGETINDIDFLFGVDVVENDHEEHRTMLIIQMPHGIFLITYDEIGIMTEKYNQDLFIKRFCELTKGIVLL